jgi:hypothetical protein
VAQSATPTPTATQTYVIIDFFELRDPYTAPNPHKGSGSLQVGFYATRPCDTVTVKLYSNSFRLIRKLNLGSCGAGAQVLSVPAADVSGLSNGTYYYVLIGEGNEGMTRSISQKLIVLK